jgi:alpha-glucosidase
VTRYGRPRTGEIGIVAAAGEDRPEPPPSDVALGRRRARAALLLMLALPGTAYLYQGEELGLEEVEDIPEGLLQDPTWLRSGHTIRGRDGCRVPLPWSGAAPPFGFGPEGTTPWLPQPDRWRDRTVEAETGDPSSFLELYRTALRLRRKHLGFRGSGMAWLPSPDDVLRFDRPGGVETVLNLGSTSIELPAGRPVLLASEPLPESRELPPDTAVWLD